MDRHLDIAVLSPAPSYPLDFGNRKRVHALCMALRQRGARIHFLLYPLEHDWRTAIPEHAFITMRDAWDEFHIIPPSIQIHAGAIGLDHTIDEWWDPTLDHFLQWYCARRPLDALLVNYVYLSRAFLHTRHGCLKVLDTHDRVSGRRERLAEIGLNPEWFHTTVEQEAIGVRRADLALAIKPEEQAYLESLEGPPVLTVPYIEERHSSLELAERSDGYLRIGMLGARNSINIQSVSRFLECAIPRFRDFMAPIKIILAGSMCVGLDALRDCDGVEVIGPLKNVRSFYEMVDVVVGPVDQSTGQKIRIGEALAYAVPVISHAHTFEGYQPTHPWHQLQDLEAIADACISLSFDLSKLAALRKASIASHRHQEAITSAAMDSLVDRIARSEPADLFLVDVAKLRANPLLARHIAAMVGIAASQSKVLVLLNGAPDEVCVCLVQLIRNCARIWATKAAPPGLELEEIAVAETAGALLERFHVGNIWLYGTDNIDEIAGRNYAVVATLGSIDEMPAEGTHEGYACQTAGVARFGRLIERRGEAVLCIDGGFSIPYFSQSTPEHLIGGPLFAGPRAIAVAVSPASVEFAVSAAVAIALASKKERRSVILLVAPDGMTASRIKEVVAQEPVLRRRVEIFDLSSRRLYEHAIELVVDLAAGVGAFAPMVEYAAWRGVAVLRAPIGAESYSAASLGEPGGLRFLLQVVKAAHDPEYRDELRKSWQEHRDDALAIEALCDWLGESAKWMIRDGGTRAAAVSGRIESRGLPCN